MRLEVASDISPDRPVDRREALRKGRAVAFFCMDKNSLPALRFTRYPEADVWYTDVNGDGIGLLVPRGTPPDRLPNKACDLRIWNWTNPETDQTTEVREKKRDR